MDAAGSMLPICLDLLSSYSGTVIFITAPVSARSFLATLSEEEVVESEPTTSFSFVRLVLSTGSDFTKRALLLLGHHCHYCYRHLQSKIRSAYLRKRRSSHDSDIGSLNNCSCRNHKHLILRHR